MATIYTEGNSLNPDTYVELFIFDMTLIRNKNGQVGSNHYYTNTPTGGLSAPIIWQGNSYYPLPFDFTGVDNRGDGTSFSRPSLNVSNLNKELMISLISMGDLVGTKVTRYRTFYKFTDNGTEPNAGAYFPVNEYYITRKVSQNNKALQFEMSGALDRPGLKLPRRVILRDLGFPGVSRVRGR